MARLSVRPGSCAALSILLLALSALSWTPAPALSVAPASLLLLAIAFLLCFRRHEIVVPSLLAFGSGVAGWALFGAFPAFMEPALLKALPAVLTAVFLCDRRSALLCVAFAPLFCGLMTTLQDWYLFDAAAFALGGISQLDAQLSGIFLLAMLWYLPTPFRRPTKTENAQAETSAVF